MGIARNQIRWNGWGWAAHQDSLAGQDSVGRWLANEMGMPALLATPPRPLADLSLPAPRLAPEQIAGFAAITGPDRVHQDDYERAFHARGRSYQDMLRLRAGDLSTAPDAVLYPRGEEEVLAILKQAAAEKIALIPFGGGASLSGGVTGAPGAIAVDMSGMDRVIAIDSASGTATAEAGIYGPVLERALAMEGLTLGHLPQDFEFSSLGGWIADNSAGQESALFGRAGDWLAGARLATAHGLWEIGDRPALGPDLKHLLPGSGGILGIITQATVRVRRIQPVLPRAWLFPDFAHGVTALREAAQIPHRLLLLSDAEETRVLRAFSALTNPPGLGARLKDFLVRPPGAGAAALIAGFCDGQAARRFAALAKQSGARDLGEAPAKKWFAERFQALYRRDGLLDRGVGLETLETAASWSALPGLHAAVKNVLEIAMREGAPRPGARGMVLSHISELQAGGASLTFTCLFPRRLDDEIAQAQALRRTALDAIAAHGGIADHGDELEKDSLGRTALRGVKAALDPEGIMNPGKLIS